MFLGRRELTLPFGAKLRQFLSNGGDPGTAGGLSLAIGGAGGGGGHWPPHPLLHGWGNGGGTSSVLLWFGQGKVAAGLGGHGGAR